MRHVHLIALACGLVVALIAVLLLAGGGAAGAPSPVAAATREQRGSSDAPPADAPGADAADTQAQRSAAAGAGEQLLSAPTLAVGPRGVQLLPVVGAGRRTVEPVEMWWWPQARDPNRRESESFYGLLRSCRVDALLEERAQRIAADEQGRFFAPAAKAEGFVVARGERLWGFAALAARSDDPSYVLLEPETTLQVRVVDGAGAAVEGVRVALRQHYHGQFFGDHGVALTDAQGFARLPHYRALIDGDWDFSARYSVAIAEPLNAEIARVIDVTAPPAELIELVLPPVGTVELEFEGAPANLRAGLEVLEIGQAPHEENAERFADGRRELSAGRVRFPFVGLGRDLLPWSFEGDEQRPHEDARRLGPARAGEEVRLRVRMEGSATRVSGRLVGEAGRVLADARLELNAWSEVEEDEGWNSVSVRTDAEGRFSAPLVFRWVGSSLLGASGENLDGRRFSCESRRLVVAPGAPTLELGDLQVLEAPLLASGKVVDRDGAPVPFALIDARERIRHVFPTGDSYIQWRDHARNARCDANGAFVVWGECSTGRVSLQVKSATRRSTPTVVQCKQLDVVLVLDRDGAIAGRVLLPQLAPPDFVYVTAKPRIRNFHELAPEEDWSAQLDTNGEFLLAGLPPDEYEINVFHKGAEAPLATVSNVRVSERATTRDERLDPLDLRGLGELRLIEVYGPDGGPVDSVIQIERGEEPDEAGTNETSGYRLILHRDAPPLWILAEGCAFHELVPASVPPRVTLQHGPRVRVRLDDAFPKLPAELALSVSITAPGEPDWMSASFPDEIEFGAARAGAGTLRRVGALSATLRISGEYSIDLPAQFLGAARVVAVSAQQELVITCDPAQLAEALEELR